jgi:hypothetical protein
MSLENDPVVNPMDLDPIVSSPNLKDTVSTAFAPSGLVKEDAEKIYRVSASKGIRS